jgi:hypothetical protein
MRTPRPNSIKSRVWLLAAILSSLLLSVPPDARADQGAYSYRNNDIEWHAFLRQHGYELDMLGRVRKAEQFRLLSNRFERKTIDRYLNLNIKPTGIDCSKSNLDDFIHGRCSTLYGYDPPE